MILEYSDIEHVNKIHKFIIEQCHPEDVAEIKCKSCNGTGLIYDKLYDGYSWNNEYCDECKGIGYFIEEQINVKYYYCPYCNSKLNSICSFCKGYGIVTWLQYMIGVKQ